MSQANAASSTRAPDLSPIRDLSRRIPTPLIVLENAYQAYRRRILAQLDAMDAALERASAEMLAEMRANRAAGHLPPVARLKSDEQWDHDLAREDGWGGQR
jgi:hypothetical protein